jgi:AsmA protein
MNALVRALLIIVASIVGLVVLASVALYLFFDPNDYREEIAAGVKDATGRDLTIEGDLSLSIFPWLAIEVGRTELGNASGFSDEPFLRFEEASLSVRMLPLILSQETTVGTASIEGLVVNLEVAADGTTNWDDFSRTEEPAGFEIPESDTEPTKVEMDNIEVRNANVSYTDAQSGSAYSITDLVFDSDGIGADEPFHVDAEFDFTVTPGDLGGHVAIRGTTTMTEGAAQVSIEGLNVSGELRGVTTEAAEFNFDSREMAIDTVAQSASPGEMDLSILGVSMSANVEPFSYADSPRPKAALQVAEFSLKELMRKLDIEPPATADANALGRVSFSANAVVREKAIALRSMALALDDSTMVGDLILPTTEKGAIRFDLKVDAINLDGYMAPADTGAASRTQESNDDMEIPVDMIRGLKANGSFKIDRALLSGMEFTNVELGLRSANGKLRLNPLAAELHDGTYNGDVRVNASKDVPSISVDEKLSGVNLASLAKSMFDQDNISGTINGSFALRGAGRNLAAIRQDLGGNMSLELVDGAWEGTDVWHQLRAARAMFRQEPAPEPSLPARTEFTSVSATGTVTDGIFENDDLLIELPFLQLTGKGFVDLPAGQVDYSVEARVFDNPELMAGVTEAELADFTKTVVPVRITGSLTSPSVRPDIEAVFRQQVEGALEEQKEELKNRLFDKLLGGDDDRQPDEQQPGEQTEEEAEDVEEEDLEEQLKNKLLKDLIGR